MYTRRLAQRFIAGCVIGIFGLNISTLNRPSRADDSGAASGTDLLIERLKPYRGRYRFLAGAPLPPPDGSERARLAAILADAGDQKTVERRLDAAIARSFLAQPVVYIDGWALSKVDLDIIHLAASEAESGLH